MDTSTIFSRLQFAFTISFHYLFPQFTMGLALLLVILKVLYLWRKDERFNTGCPFLGENLCDHICVRGGDGHPNGVPIWHELGAFLGLRG